MSERVMSFFILLGGALMVLALWALSVLAVRWDTRKRRLTEMEQRAWFAVALVLPLFGFALYLALRVMRRYLTPQGGEGMEDPLEAARMTSVRERSPWPGTELQESASGFGSPNSVPAWGPPKKPGSNGTGPHNISVFGGEVQTGTLPAAPTVTVALVVAEGPHTGQQFILNHLPAVIGRGEDAAVPLDADLNVSRRHAEIYDWNNTLRIRDLHSMHGTQVNDKAITDQPLVPGDRVRLGGTVFIVQAV